MWGPKFFLAHTESGRSPFSEFIRNPENPVGPRFLNLIRELENPVGPRFLNLLETPRIRSVPVFLIY